jgi:hypothetical protein
MYGDKPAAHSSKVKTGWRWVRRFAALFALYICAQALYFWWKYESTAAAGKAQLEAAIAETDALDPNWRWEALSSQWPEIRDAENSIHIVRKAVAALPSSGREKLNVTAMRLPNGEAVIPDSYSPNRRLDDERLIWIRNFLAERVPSVAIAASLKNFPRGHASITLNPILINTLMPHLEDGNQISSLLQLDCENLLHSEDPSECVDRIHALLHVGAGVRGEPILISQMLRIRRRQNAVRDAERMLAMTKLSDTKLKELESHFRSESNEDLLLPGLRGERATYHKQFDDVESGKLSLADFMAGSVNSRPPDLQLRIGAFIYGARLYEDHAVLLVHLNECCRIAQLPFRDQRAKWLRLNDDIQNLKAQSANESRWIFSILLAPAAQKVSLSAQADKAHVSCTLAALAAERFRLANQRWPETLDELCPQFFPKVPTDPFDGEPLRMSKRDDGVVIYSVGRDGEDNGGEHLDPSKQHPTESSDLGVRLWNPDRRRLPPEAKKSENPER